MADAQIKQLGRYRVLAELGRGAMGVVYKAEDTLLNRTVAVKTIRLASDAMERNEYEARFHQEAKAVAGLNHPNIIIVYDVGREGDIAYMAMELLEGVDLREVMREAALPLPRALDIVAQVAEGLAHAHEQGIVHRDIKPGNIMVVRGQHAKIMDFGIAKVRLSDVKTQSGSMLGSPKYMSPEQVSGVRADHRSDIFSLGVTIYELLSGVPPFDAPEIAQLMYQIASATPRPPSTIKPSLPTMIDLIIGKALEKDPDARYQDARELAADLRAYKAQLDSRAPGNVDLEATIKLQASFQNTVKLGRPAPAAAPVMRPIVSRRFDSTSALAKIARPAPAGPAALPSRVPSGFKRWFRDPAQRIVAAAVFVAVALAVAIALL